MNLKEKREMKQYNIGILGITGAVGQEMLKVLEERQLPVASLRVFASKRSVGKEVLFLGEVLTVEELTSSSFEGLDIVLSALDDDVAAIYLPEAVKNGCLVIDNSSMYRLDDATPLVIPEVNGEDILTHQGIIANPNCSTIIALTAVAALHKEVGIKSMVVSTYQAVSGAGVQGIAELEEQITALEEGREVVPRVFSRQIAYNVIPQIGGFSEQGDSSEEAKLQNEGRKILHQPELDVSCTCVRIPVMRSHSEAITLFFEEELELELAKQLLSNAPGVRFMDEQESGDFPTPLDTTGQDLVYVGRVREQRVAGQQALALWCCGDQVRKGAATNAVQIAQAYIAYQK